MMIIIKSTVLAVLCFATSTTARRHNPRHPQEIQQQQQSQCRNDDCLRYAKVPWRTQYVSSFCSSLLKTTATSIPRSISDEVEDDCGPRRELVSRLSSACSCVYTTTSSGKATASSIPASSIVAIPSSQKASSTQSSSSRSPLSPSPAVQSSVQASSSRTSLAVSRPSLSVSASRASSLSLVIGSSLTPGSAFSGFLASSTTVALSSASSVSGTSRLASSSRASLSSAYGSFSASNCPSVSTVTISSNPSCPSGIAPVPSIVNPASNICPVQSTVISTVTASAICPSVAASALVPSCTGSISTVTASAICPSGVASVPSASTVTITASSCPLSSAEAPFSTSSCVCPSVLSSTSVSAVAPPASISSCPLASVSVSTTTIVSVSTTTRVVTDATSCAIGRDLVVNGGFEQGDLSGYTTGGEVQPTTRCGGDRNFAFTGQCGGLFQFPANSAGKSSVLTQSIPGFCRGLQYRVRFLFKITVGCTLQLRIVQAATQEFTDTGNPSGWAEYSNVLTTNAGEVTDLITYPFEFTARAKTNQACGVSLDDFSVTRVAPT